MEKEYVNILKKMLNKKDFSKLTNELFNQVNNKYQRIDIIKATKLVEYNMATILVIGIEIVKDEKIDIKKTIEWYNICPESKLLVSNCNDFIIKYKYYINEIIKKVKEESGIKNV